MSNLIAAGKRVENARKELDEAMADLKKEILKSYDEGDLGVTAIAKRAGLARQTVYDVVNEAEAKQ